MSHSEERKKFAELQKKYEEVVKSEELHVRRVFPLFLKCCSWPDHCEGTPARERLDDIAVWCHVDRQANPPRVEEDDHEKILEQVARCLHPELNKDGIHVCQVVSGNPAVSACVELQGIHVRANDARVEPDPGEAKKLWTKVRSDLEDFPGGR